MPDLITIDRDQRDGLYELVRNHLASIEDFWVAFERTRDFDKAERTSKVRVARRTPLVGPQPGVPLRNPPGGYGRKSTYVIYRALTLGPHAILWKKSLHF